MGVGLLETALIKDGWVNFHEKREPKAAMTPKKRLHCTQIRHAEESYKMRLVRLLEKE